jgi:chromosome segregation ATPase
MRFCRVIIILPFLCWPFEVRAQNEALLGYQQLTGQAQELRQSIDDQQRKNDRMELFLKEKRGQSDQQLRIEELTQMVKTKKQEARSLDAQLRDLGKKKSKLDRKIQALKRSGVNGQHLNRKDAGPEGKELEDRLNILQLQKSQYMKRYSDAQLAQVNAHRYEQLKRRRDQLEANISVYESRMEELRESSLRALEWPIKRKKLVHEIVQTDAQNNKIRNKIKTLREDIDVLRDQIGVLERRVNFANSQDTKY